MALTRVSGRVVYPHGEDTPTPVTGDGVIEYAHASPGVIGEAVHGPDRHRIEYTDGVVGEAWLKAGMWRAYVYPSEGRSYTLHLGIPEGGDVTLADVVGEVVPEGIVTRGEQGDPGASVVGGRDNGDGTVSFELSDGTFTDPVVLPPGPAGRGIASISDPDADSRVTITFTDDTTTTVQAIRGADGHSPVITWDGTTIVTDGTPGPDLKGEPGDPGPASTVPGPANVLSIGTVTSGETASATITGTSPAQVLSLVLPKGEKGDPGAGGGGASDYLVVGPGRPDAPTTTGMTSAALAALPVGCEYRSTDGAGTGAWVWQKRPTGWVVISGDTGWVDVSLLCFIHETGAYVTESGRVYMRMTTEATEVRFGYFPPPASSGQSLRVPPLKAWLPAWSFNSGRQLPVGVHEYFGDIALKAYTSNWMSPDADSYWRLPRSTNWPTTLPS